MKLIAKAIKITLNKASKRSHSGFFGKPENVTRLKNNITTILESKEFKNVKVLIEFGSAVGGMIILVGYFWYPQVSDLIEQLNERVDNVDQKLDLLLEEIHKVAENKGLKSEPVETAVIEANPIEDILKDNEKKARIIAERERTIQTQKTIIQTGAAIGLAAIILTFFAKPGHAFEIVEDLFR